MKKKVPRSFGEKLKYAREHFGMSRNELAIRAQITQPYISALESGKRKEPSFVKVQAISKALGVPIEYFADDTLIPLEVVKEMLPPDLQEFVSNQENIPLLRVAKEAGELNLSAESLSLYIKALSKASKLTKNVEK